MRHRSLFFPVAALALALACAEPPTEASDALGPNFITSGTPDAGEHPYVGFLLSYDPTVPEWFSCTGTLLNETALLTAGHCAFNVGTNGAITPGGSGGNDMWVSFASKIDFTGFPQRAAYPDEASLYAARSAWLNANPAFIRGTSVPHPAYNNFADFPASHDVGMVTLDAPAGIGQYGVLASLGTLDALAGAGKGHNKVIVETAGYGDQSIKPKFVSLAERWKATSTILNLRNAATDGWNVQLSDNPSAANGQGGSCFGDSGGGVFLNNTNVIVAVVSFGANKNCKGVSYSARTDITDAQDFILGFLH
jgi:secreted trypsin-like serine protease